MSDKLFNEFSSYFDKKVEEEKEKREKREQEKFLKISEMEWVLAECRRLEGLLGDFGALYKRQQKWLALNDNDPRYEKLSKISEKVLEMGKYLKARKKYLLNQGVKVARSTGYKIEYLQIKTYESELINKGINWNINLEEQLKNFF